MRSEKIGHSAVGVIGLCFFFSYSLFIESFIIFFSSRRFPIHMTLSPASFGSRSSFSLCIISVFLFQFNLQANSQLSVIMQFLYSFHAISHCCNVMPLNFFLSRLLFTSKFSFPFQRVNVASTLS